MVSLVLDRDSNDGSLALGGLPPVDRTGTFASARILMVNCLPMFLALRNIPDALIQIELLDDAKMKTEYSFYTIIADAYVYMGSQKTRANTSTWGQLVQNTTVNTTQFPVIVDSGTTLMYLPTGELI